jgi:hypothetical protein
MVLLRCPPFAHEGHIKKGLLHMRVTGDEWLVRGKEDGPVVPDSYVVSFVHFHERGLVSPPTISFMGCFTTMGSSYSI